MKTPSLIIACCTLLTATSAHAIDAECRRLLERSGCTQVTEARGCDSNKTLDPWSVNFGPGSTARRPYGVIFRC